MNEPEVQTRSGRMPTVVNVNDNEGARFMTTLMLRRAGYHVVECGDATSALAAAEQCPDVMVLDIRLPDMNGFQVCQRIKSNPDTASIKVLMTSATFTTSDNRIQGLELGADGYLTQPFEPEELAATINSLVRLRSAERALRTQADELADADRRKDEFLAMLAHELRNPLAAISAAVPVLMQHLASDGEQALEVVERQVTHLGRLVDELLDVARVTSGKIEVRKERLDLAMLVGKVVTTFRERGPRARDQILKLSMVNGSVLVDGDATRLEQVVTNLLDNASKYTDPGGEIRVDLQVRQLDDRAQAVLIVRDTGIGIPEAALSKIFGLFAQADVPIDRSRGGLGIGLTLTQKLVELHGGQVVARSEGEGKGSEFEVTLPCVLGPAAASPRNGRDRATRGAPQRRIVIVEDNADVRLTLAALCRMWGHEVHLAPDGASGVQMILEEQPDIALVDIGLPGVDGFEVARRVRQDTRGRGLLLVALTGYGSSVHRQQAFDSGFDVHMVKPVSAERLERLLTTLSDREGAA